MNMRSLLPALPIIGLIVFGSGLVFLIRSGRIERRRGITALVLICAALVCSLAAIALNLYGL